jgi:hypothetical protein
VLLQQLLLEHLQFHQVELVIEQVQLEQQHDKLLVQLFHLQEHSFLLQFDF